MVNEIGTNRARGWWRWLSKPSVLVLELLVSGALFFGFGREALQQYRVSRQIQSLKDQVETLEARRDDLTELSSFLQSSWFLEREARLKLGLQKPGEQQIVLEADASTAEPDSNEDGVSLRRLSNAAKWFAYLFDRPTFESLRAAWKEQGRP